MEIDIKAKRKNVKLFVGRTTNEQELQEIKETWIDSGYSPTGQIAKLAVKDVLRLLDEVERLRNDINQIVKHAEDWKRQYINAWAENERLRKALDEIRRGRLYDRLKMQEIAREALEE